MFSRLSRGSVRSSSPSILALATPIGVILLLVASSLSLASCAQSDATKHTEENGSTELRPYTTAEVARNEEVQLPAWASGPEQEGYQFALAHPDILEYIPCYCGCGLTSKHKSNLDCYIRGVDANGAVTFDNHAVSCGVCLDITLDVKRLSADGKSLKEIRGYIDDRYGQVGPGTDTPAPPA